eukprot:125623-Prorocentrum_minimum.AAC.1
MPHEGGDVALPVGGFEGDAGHGVDRPRRQFGHHSVFEKVQTPPGQVHRGHPHGHVACGEFSPPTSEFRPLTSEFSPPTSEFSPPTSEFRPLKSEFSPPTSEFRPLTSEYSPPT